VTLETTKNQGQVHSDQATKGLRMLQQSRPREMAEAADRSTGLFPIRFRMTFRPSPPRCPTQITECMNRQKPDSIALIQEQFPSLGPTKPAPNSRKNKCSANKVFGLISRRDAKTQSLENPNSILRFLMFSYCTLTPNTIRTTTRIEERDTLDFRHLKCQTQ